MREPVAGHPPGIFRPVPTTWYAAEIVFRQRHDYSVEIDRDVGQLPTDLGDGDDGVTPSSIESREGMWVPVRKDLYFSGDRTADLEENVVAFLGELQRNDVGDGRWMSRDVNVGRFVVSRGLSLSILRAPQGRFTFVRDL